MGIGDWGLGIGDWAQSPIPNPQSPIPNPQSPFDYCMSSIINKFKNLFILIHIYILFILLINGLRAHANRNI